MASALVQPGAVVQINLVCLYDAQLVMNTFHYWADPARSVGSTTIAQVMTKWELQIWQPSIVGATDGLSDLLGAGVTDAKLTGQIIIGSGSRSRSEVYLLDPSDGGYPTGNPLPSGASVVVQRVGSLAGAKYQGRMYLFGLTTGAIVASKLTPAGFTAVQTWADRLNAPFVFGAGATLMTLTPCLTNGVLAPVAGQFDLTHIVTSPVRYQRRREVGVGQ
jgi:hypothetical protein